MQFFCAKTAFARGLPFLSLSTEGRGSTAQPGRVKNSAKCKMEECKKVKKLKSLRV